MRREDLTPVQEARLVKITGDPGYYPISLKVCSSIEVDSVLVYMEYRKWQGEQKDDRKN